MIVTIAVVGGLLGLALLLLPRGWMLFGQRWTLQDGDRAEPSDLSVIAVRVVAVVIIIATAVSCLALAGMQQRNANAAELEELWDVRLQSGDRVTVVADPDIITGGSKPLRDREVSLAPTRTAIVGRDDLGDLGGVSSFQDGDVLVGLGYTACTFRYLRVTHDGDDTEVGIVVELPQVDGDPPTPLAPYDILDLCTRRFSDDDAPIGLTVFRVPTDD